MNRATLRQYQLLRGKGYRASEAYRMVTARERAEANDLTFEWEFDDLYTEVLEFCECKGYTNVCIRCGYEECRNTWPFGNAVDGGDHEHAYHEHEVLVCIVYDGNGDTLAALGGIVDAGNPLNWKDYAFDVECELAIEAMAALESNPNIALAV